MCQKFDFASQTIHCSGLHCRPSLLPNPVLLHSTFQVTGPLSPCASSFVVIVSAHRKFTTGEISPRQADLTNHVRINPTHRLKSVANVQIVCLLARPPQFSDRADQKSRRWRDGIRNTRGVVARNEIDFARSECVSICSHCETHCAAWQNGKVLNLRRDLKCWTTVTDAPLRQKKFINCLSLMRARWRFESGVRRYADKWLTKSCIFLFNETG